MCHAGGGGSGETLRYGGWEVLWQMHPPIEVGGGASMVCATQLLHGTISCCSGQRPCCMLFVIEHLI